MLVLSRKLGEAIMVGDVPVRVVEIRPGFVRLGIVAPREVTVHREEVYQEIRRQEHIQRRKQQEDLGKTQEIRVDQIKEELKKVEEQDAKAEKPLEQDAKAE